MKNVSLYLIFFTKLVNTCTYVHKCTHASTQRTGNPGVPGSPLSPFRGTIPITPPGSPCREQNINKWFGRTTELCFITLEDGALMYFLDKHICTYGKMLKPHKIQLTFIPGSPGMPWKKKTVVKYIHMSTYCIFVVTNNYIFRYCLLQCHLKSCNIDFIVIQKKSKNPFIVILRFFMLLPYNVARTDKCAGQWKGGWLSCTVCLQEVLEDRQNRGRHPFLFLPAHTGHSQTAETALKLCDRRKCQAWTMNLA